MEFENYQQRFREHCLVLFDQNCPEFFAPNERADYAEFLDSKPHGYKVGISEGKVTAAFGIAVNADSNRARVTWIMVSKSTKGQGIGAQMMQHTKEITLQAGASIIDIAASHLSAPFFAKYQAVAVAETADGWGPGMHRVDMEIYL